MQREQKAVRLARSVFALDFGADTSARMLREARLVPFFEAFPHDQRRRKIFGAVLEKLAVAAAAAFSISASAMQKASPSKSWLSGSSCNRDSSRRFARCGKPHEQIKGIEDDDAPHRGAFPRGDGGQLAFRINHDD